MAAQDTGSPQKSPPAGGFSPDLIRQLIQQELAQWQGGPGGMNQPASGPGPSVSEGTLPGPTGGGAATPPTWTNTPGQPPQSTGGPTAAAGLPQGTPMYGATPSQSTGMMGMPQPGASLQMQSPQPDHQELNQELSQNLQRLKTILQETQGIAQKMEAILRDAGDTQGKKTPDTGGR